MAYYKLTKTEESQGDKRLYWIDDDGEWLGATPYKENITEEEVEQIKTELRKKKPINKKII